MSEKRKYTWEELNKDYVKQLNYLTCFELDRRAESLKNKIIREGNKEIKEEFENRLKYVEKIEKEKMCELHLSIEEVKLEKEEKRQKGEESRRKTIEKKYEKIDNVVIEYLKLHPEIIPINRMRVMMEVEVKGVKGVKEMGEEMTRKSIKRLLESEKIMKNVITEKYEVVKNE